MPAVLLFPGIFRGLPIDMPLDGRHRQTHADEPPQALTRLACTGIFFCTGVIHSLLITPVYCVQIFGRSTGFAQSFPACINKGAFHVKITAFREAFSCHSMVSAMI